MLAVVSSHAPLGVDGEVVTVEVDVRRGMPGIDVVGLPDGAVRESRERVRVAIRNSGFRFPVDRILVNLAPAGIRKIGASFDLPIAVGVLVASEQIPPPQHSPLMILGELNLSGLVRPVNGVLSAVGAGLARGIRFFLVPRANLREAAVLGDGVVWGIGSLREAVDRLVESVGGSPEPEPPAGCEVPGDEAGAVEQAFGNLSDIRGHGAVKRALEVAAAGRHNLLLFGPPGAGKTMSAKRLVTLLPPLEREEALLVTRIHSMAGLLPPGGGLIRRPPFRMPHHTASTEGLIGGGRAAGPGEVSLAHGGILFLDEAAEFRQSLLQSLREPVEEGRITVVRAGRSIPYPASIQLVLASNPCPCGNLGRDQGVCVCSRHEVERYWRRMGGALLDRIDVRVPVAPVPVEQMVAPPGESSREVRARVLEAVERQRLRFRGTGIGRNARIPPGRVADYCPLDDGCASALTDAVSRLSLSSRACHSILKVARTVADLAGSEEIREEHVMEAVVHRRFGEDEPFWSYG